MTLHPQIIKKGGRNEFIVLPYEEYVRIRAILDDLEDLEIIESVKRADRSQGVSLSEVVRTQIR